MSCISTKLPLLLERAGVRRLKSSAYIPLIPAFSLWRRSSRTCVDTYALRACEYDVQVCHAYSLTLLIQKDAKKKTSCLRGDILLRSFMQLSVINAKVVEVLDREFYNNPCSANE
jgi:hypothetical protein